MSTTHARRYLESPPETQLYQISFEDKKNKDAPILCRFGFLVEKKLVSLRYIFKIFFTCDAKNVVPKIVYRPVYDAETLSIH